MIDPIKLSQNLIRQPSVSPNDGDCQQLIRTALEKAGFQCHDLSINGTRNLYASHGTGEPQLLLAGHTDVVPAGEHWSVDPFAATINGDKLYGRGAVDMKTALAAMISAAIDFIHAEPNHPGTLAFAITSDEEGDADFGSLKIVEYLKDNNQYFNYCLIGEPSSQAQLGDTCKVGRRGSLHAALTIHGQQGHIAYPQLADNPIPKALGALKQLCEQQWCQGNQDFPATNMQISNLQAGNGVLNMIPADLNIKLNFRYSPELTDSDIIKQTESILNTHPIQYSIDWRLSAKPFYTKPAQLATICQQAIKTHCQIDTEFSTSGGTSDGRFLCQVCDELIELGMINQTAHQIDEHCTIDDIKTLRNCYRDILENVFILSK